ncbi:hypothetical protein RhiirA4_456448 [Rhizophagus irregularis]|uniref:BED-type domain-containing protein n=1 Tax=Rhizophagus irregularis TaxID=588596 RepID=A0A2I1G7K3_9GLOM|nr:hypothetical protein RhiirA4_456448 [Rhizophagus irregularis]
MEKKKEKVWKHWKITETESNNKKHHSVTCNYCSKTNSTTKASQSSTSFTAKQQNKHLKNAKIENFMDSISEEEQDTLES